jgi:glycine/D-amino acid oxidase-like deaminating enzyme/nitrite reductase/ring-hydroxylating ferredoxin subunit
MPLRKIESLWTATTPKTDYPDLKTDIETDVAVIGGGMAGLNAAYFLVRESRKVTVIESARIATGTTGNTTAKITSQHSLKYSFLKKHFGLSKARIYADSNQWAIEEIARIITEEKINCDFRRLPAYVYALTEKNLKKIDRELAVCQKIGLPATFTEKIESVPFSIKGALKFENQAYFHPRKYLLALAEKIIARGGIIFERTKALGIQTGDPIIVITDKGKIKAKKVIVATNYPFFDKGLFFLRTSQARSYGLAARLKDIAPDGMFINEGKKEKTLSFRPHKSAESEWLIVGGESHPVGEKEETDHFSNLEKIASEKFNLPNVDYIWSAQDSMSLDRVPFIGKMPFSKDFYVTTGFGKWGMTTSLVSAKILADLIAGRKNDWVRLYKPGRFNLTASFLEIIELFIRVMKSYGRYFRKEEKFKLSELEYNEGRVISFKNEKIAVYKDKNGKIQSHSAVCTHLGCIVAWNSTEKTWDCPCHGSRFRYDGTVLQGPAVKSLPDVNLK